MSWDVSERAEDVLDLGLDDRSEALEAERDDLLNGPCVSPYRCTDRMCGALDCLNCYPQTADEEPEPEPEEHDDEPEPDGRWVQAHGCWIYE